MPWESISLNGIELGTLSSNSSYWGDSGRVSRSQDSGDFLGLTRNIIAPTANLQSSQWIFGNSTLGLYLNKDTNYVMSWQPYDSTQEHTYLTNVSTGLPRTPSEYPLGFTVIIGINEEQQLGQMMVTWGWANNPSVYYTLDRSGASNQLYNWSKHLMQAYPSYTWQSVAGVTGKYGTFNFSRVLDDSLLTGEDIARIELEDMSESVQARFAVLQQNLPNGVTTPVIYAGLVDNFAITMKYQGGLDNKYDINLNINTVFSIEGNLSSSSLGFIKDDENEVAKMVRFTPIHEAGILTAYSMTVPAQTDTEMHNIWLWLFTHTDPEDDPEINEGDEGTDPNYQPDIAVTGITKPSYGAIDTGFTKMYRMSKTQLKALSSFLWSSSFIDNVKKFFNDPREIIVGLCIMPVLPTTGTSEEVSAGGISTGVYGLPLTDQYTDPDVYGTCEVKAEKGNFLDYDPFTKVTAHLPFVGSHSLNVSDVMGKTLSLKYIFDFMSGSCVAEIDVDGSPHYFFGGSCGIQIPTSSEDFGRMYSSILSAGATIGSTLATIATGGLTAPLAIGAGVNMLSNGMNASPTVDFASGSGSINGMIGCKTAFLTIERAKEKIVGEQQKYLGRPSYMTRTLSSCTGYTKCMNVHLDNVPCTETERAEIERLLISGVRIASSGSPTPEYTPTGATDHGLIFLKCESDTGVMGKTWDTEHTLTVEGKLMYEQSFLKPVFVVDGDYTAYNYCYIPEFDRFYFITEQIAKTGSITEIHMQVDVLQSWQTQIKTNKAVIERSANKGNNNAYFVDSMYWTQADKEVKTVPFKKANGDELVFEIPADNYILTIAGGS